jgi:Mg2+/Co2+ transporter CorB
MTAILLLLAAAASLALAAFCAGAETGFLSVSRERILHLSRAGGSKAALVQSALSEMSRTMTTLLIGNNLAAVAYSSASAALALEVVGTSRPGNAAWSAVSAVVVLYVSEFMPKMLCAARPLYYCLKMARAYRALSAVLSPVAAVAISATSLFVPRKEPKYRLTGRDLMRILRDRKDGVCISDIESALIGRIVACRAKGRPVTAAELVDAVRDAD